MAGRWLITRPTFLKYAHHQKRAEEALYYKKFHIQGTVFGEGLGRAKVGRVPLYLLDTYFRKSEEELRNIRIT